MSKFKPGDKVRCINADPMIYRQMLPQNLAYSNYMSGLTEGEIYTVRNTDICFVHRGHDELSKQNVDLTGVRLEELKHGTFDMPFGASRFELVINE